MMKFPPLFAALVAFVIAPWFALAPPAAAAPPQCTCFPNEDGLGVALGIALALAELNDDAVVSCDTHPAAAPFQDNGVDANITVQTAFATIEFVYSVLILRADLQDQSVCGAPFGSDFLVDGETLLPDSASAWACMRQLTAHCRGRGF